MNGEAQKSAGSFAFDQRKGPRGHLDGLFLLGRSLRILHDEL